MRADQVTAPWAGSLAAGGIGLAVLAAITALATPAAPGRCAGFSETAAHGPLPEPPRASALEPTTYVHVQFRHYRGAAAARVSSASYLPLFTHIDVVRADDPRPAWVRIEIPVAAAQAFAARLAAHPTVEQAFVAPEITLANHGAAFATVVAPEGASCPVTTPSFESYQGYLGPAPHGIDAPAAWRRGHRGGGVWFADIEGGWNAAHEDLPGDRITHVAGQPIPDRSWRAHGTAVLGQVVGRDNGKGVVGIAPDVERVFTASIGGIAVADAIDAAARELRAGDVLLIELQSSGPRGRYIPVEYWDDIYAAIHLATRRGVVVIEAAGNGGENLDHPSYKRAFDRSRRDSGAIMVGAGAPPRAGFADRERLDFSNYGGRVDVQGWGRKVATLDYGDLQACEDAADQAYADRDYTGEFSGTSSASPIVAGAAVILQGIARGRGQVLPPATLRELLRRTGTPQAGNTREAIGPRPDLERAISALPN